MTQWCRADLRRNIVLGIVGLLIVILLYAARRSLLPFLAGTLLAYILLPLVETLNSFLPPRFRRASALRTLSVLAVYALVLALIVALLAFVIPSIAAQIESLIQRLPGFATRVYEAVPVFVQDWLDRYEAVPENIQAALQRGMESVVQTLINAVQTGVSGLVSLVFSTLSFVLGLVVIPLWTFYVLRDQPRLRGWFYGVLPPSLRTDGASMVKIVDRSLNFYLRGRLLLGACMTVMATAGLGLLGLDAALLLGTIMGLLEVVPLVGPMLGAIPVLVVTLSASPSKLPAVLLLIAVAHLIVHYAIRPRMASNEVRVQPALVMLAIVVGSEVAGLWGVLLSVPLTAIVRDSAHYLLLRVSENALPPTEALARVLARNRSA